MAQNLAPLPQPGFSVHPGYMATQPHTFISKEKSSTWSGKVTYTISYASPNAEPIAPFLEISGDKKQVSFRDPQGRVVMSIAKRKHAMGWKPTTYHGLRSDGVELWVLTLDQGSFKGTEYGLAFPVNSPAAANRVVVQNKVNGADKGILINGMPGASMSIHKAYTTMHRTDLINVAPGMDILLALGINWIRADKQAQDAKVVAGAVS